MLAAVESGVPIFEYTPAEEKQSIVGYGRAEKTQVQSMVQLLLGLAAPPSPLDASDALAIAVCHLHKANIQGAATPVSRRSKTPGQAATWRAYRPAR
jgi:crossover junction endodeoxyribonuclease RuvC